MVHATRRVLDRVVAPYVDTVVTEVRAAAGAASPAAGAATPAGHGTSDAFHHINHTLRTIELERVPKGAQRVLSVGANGRWYFDWFEAALGPVVEHVGIEAFEPRPADLPPYVHWVAETADHMAGVADGSIDLVFAGQTTEHLWSDELAGFLEEAHRVLRPGGLLVLDSPNRLVTERLRWSHGGHTVELSPDEIRDVVGVAGFEVGSVVGIWRCDLGAGVLELEEGIEDPAVVARRTSTALDHPDDSFVWWLTATRADPAPTVELRPLVRQLFDSHWDRRASRGLFPAPDVDRLPIEPGRSGPVGESLPFPLRAGQHRLTAALAAGDWADLPGFRVELVAPGGEVLHVLDAASADPAGGGRTWAFDQPDLCFAVIARVAVDGATGPAAVRLPLAWHDDV
jgi:SAM-dependent methyltransferase